MVARPRRSPKARDEPAREHRKEQAREKIQWRGEEDHDHKGPTDRDKRPRDSPARAERRHTSRHDRVRRMSGTVTPDEGILLLWSHRACCTPTHDIAIWVMPC